MAEEQLDGRLLILIIVITIALGLDCQHWLVCTDVFMSLVRISGMAISTAAFKLSGPIF